MPRFTFIFVVRADPTPAGSKHLWCLFAGMTTCPLATSSISLSSSMCSFFATVFSCQVFMPLRAASICVVYFSDIIPPKKWDTPDQGIPREFCLCDSSYAGIVRIRSSGSSQRQLALLSCPGSYRFRIYYFSKIFKPCRPLFQIHQ